MKIADRDQQVTGFKVKWLWNV